MKNKDLIKILSNFHPDIEVTIQNVFNPFKPKEILSVEKRIITFKCEEMEDEIVVLRFEK